jgi:uncharacterized SAM-binding protein YcdF (DUF218 family)
MSGRTNYFKQQIQAITEFIFVEDSPQKADLIFVPGGDYPDAAIHAAELYREGYADRILPSGKFSILKDRFTPAASVPGEEHYLTECAYLCHILREHGVPEEALLREEEAAYTWQNAVFSRRKVEEEGLTVRRAMIACQAFHARRCLMYYQEQFPETELLVCPVVTKNTGKDNWYRTPSGIDTVLGELERCGGQFHEIMKMQLCGASAAKEE